MTPTQRALADARELGMQAQVVERWNAYAKVRIDLFDCIDIVAVHEGVGVLGIQACAGASHAARRDKAIASERLLRWLGAGGRFEVWSYSKVNGGKRGGRKLWKLRREELVADGDAVKIKE